MFKYKKYLFLILFAISSSIFNNARANTILKCSGEKQTLDVMQYFPSGVFKEFIEFTISENNGFLVIIGADIPVYKFLITTRVDDALISKVNDTQGYEWLVRLNRYSGEIRVFRARADTNFVQIMIEGNCKKHEKLM